VRNVDKLVIDASVALKWVVEEDGTVEALALLKRAKLSAPDFSISGVCERALEKGPEERVYKG
jgi:predicted nucleic acid-binding protein